MGWKRSSILRFFTGGGFFLHTPAARLQMYKREDLAGMMDKMGDLEKMMGAGGEAMGDGEEAGEEGEQAAQKDEV